MRFTVTRGVTRPVWEPDAGGMALYERARHLREALGQPLPHRSAGGGSDGNFTGADGIPTLDGLGPLGAGYHTLEEHLLMDTLPRAARLFAGATGDDRALSDVRLNRNRFGRTKLLCSPSCRALLPSRLAQEVI